MSRLPSSGGPRRRHRVLLIEEDEEWRQLLADALSASGDLVKHASDAQEGSALARVLWPDVVLLGSVSDGSDPLEVCWALRSVTRASILVVRRRSAGWGECLVLELGGATRDVELLSFSQLIARVRIATPRRWPREAGPVARVPDAETAGCLRIDRQSRRVHLAGRELSLPARQFDLLSFLLVNRGRVLSVEVILAHVWPQQATLQSTKTVAVHVRWLRQKLAGQEDVAIVTVRGAGYRLDVSGRLSCSHRSLAGP